MRACVDGWAGGVAFAEGRLAHTSGYCFFCFFFGDDLSSLTNHNQKKESNFLQWKSPAMQHVMEAPLVCFVLFSLRASADDDAFDRLGNRREAEQDVIQHSD